MKYITPTIIILLLAYLILDGHQRRKQQSADIAGLEAKLIELRELGHALERYSFSNNPNFSMILKANQEHDEKLREIASEIDNIKATLMTMHRSKSN